jgi:hypothetical protein
MEMDRRKAAMGKHGALYDARWRKRRAAWLREHPLCHYCLLRGKAVAAVICDHVTPHRGNLEKFEGAIQSLCATCHQSDKARQEAGGMMRGCGAGGVPLDPSHHWNAGMKPSGGRFPKEKHDLERPHAQVSALRVEKKSRR